MRETEILKIGGDEEARQQSIELTDWLAELLLWLHSLPFFQFLLNKLNSFFDSKISLGHLWKFFQKRLTKCSL